MPQKDKKKRKKNLYTVRANGLRGNPIKLKAGPGKKKKKTPAKKKGGNSILKKPSRFKVTKDRTISFGETVIKSIPKNDCHFSKRPKLKKVKLTEKEKKEEIKDVGTARRKKYKKLCPNPKHNIYTTKGGFECCSRFTVEKIKAGAKKKKKTPAKKKAGSIRGIRRQLGSSTGRYGKIRRTTPRLYYAPIVPGIPETAAMRGWGRHNNNNKKKKCNSTKKRHFAPVRYQPFRAGRKKKE